MPITKETFTTQDSDAKTLRSLDATSKLTVFRRFKVSRSTIARAQIAVRTLAGSGSFSTWYVRGSIDGIEYLDFATPITITAINGAVRTPEGGIDVSDLDSIEVGQLTASTYTTEIVDLAVLTACLFP